MPGTLREIIELAWQNDHSRQQAIAREIERRLTTIPEDEILEHETEMGRAA